MVPLKYVNNLNIELYFIKCFIFEYYQHIVNMKNDPNKPFAIRNDFLSSLFFLTL